MERKTCFVSLPFEREVDPHTDRILDFDFVYSEIVKPAAEVAGYKSIRADELGGAISLRPLIEQILTSELFIADVTTGNPNVLYELGLRHALRPYVTLVLMADRGRLPFDLGYVRVIVYRTHKDGTISHEEAVRARDILAEAIGQGVGREGIDSPVYSLFRELRPPDFSLIGSGTQEGFSVPLRQAHVSSLESPVESLKKAEEAIKGSASVDPSAVIEIMEGYQIRSAWEEMVQFSGSLPLNSKELPQVSQMTALALNRLDRRDEAVAVVQSVIARTGGDSESYAILGLIYKELYRLEQRPGYLFQALDAYRRSYVMAPNEHYASLNLASLLALYGGEEQKKELSDLVPELRAQFANRVEDPRADPWDVAASIELAVIARDWKDASSLLPRLVPEAQWMLLAIARQLKLYLSTMSGTDRVQLEALIEAVEQQSGVMRQNA